MKAESLEKSKLKSKADEGADDSSNVSADTSKVGDALIGGEENGASNSDQVYVSLFDPDRYVY